MPSAYVILANEQGTVLCRMYVPTFEVWSNRIMTRLNHLNAL